MAQTTELISEIESAYRDDLIDDYDCPFNDAHEIIYGIGGRNPDLDWVHKFNGEIRTTDWWECIEMEEPDDVYLSYLEKKQDFFDSESCDIDPGEEVFDDEYVLPIKPYVREGKKTGRNDPCPCGSGKKYKKCCGKNI